MRNLKMYAMAVTLASAFAVNANANTVNLNYGNTDLVANPTGGSFLDLYKIVLTGSSTIDYTVTVMDESLLYPTSFTPTPTFVTLSIFNFQDGALGFNYGLYDSNDSKILNPVNLMAGNYTLKVSGITTGQFGGRYSLQANITSAVPEPETNLMMMLGLAAIGTLVYRKKNAA